AATMNNAQALAGIAAAGLVPTLVVLISNNYHGKQQEQALGLIAGAPAISGVLAFLVAGYLGTALSWRYSFGLLAVISAVVLILSFRLEPVKRQPGIKIDLIGAVLAAVAVILISFGFNNLNRWGLVVANAGAPFSLFGLSPAPFMVVTGIILGQGFFIWSQKRMAGNKTPLLALEALDSGGGRRAPYAVLTIRPPGAAVTPLI